MTDQQGTAMEPEDAKIITLARSLRVRNRSDEGAAVRDPDGRTYTGSTVALPSLRLSALQVAVVAAVSSGARGLAAAAVVTAAAPEQVDVTAVTDLSSDGLVPVLVAGPDGTLLATRTA